MRTHLVALCLLVGVLLMPVFSGADSYRPVAPERPPVSARPAVTTRPIATSRPPLGSNCCWETVLASARAADWTLAGVPGGIPTDRTQCGSTVVAGSSAATINSAISSCGANQYVQLAAGTFNLSAQVVFANKDNVTLRGMGPQGAANSGTDLVFSASGGCHGPQTAICVRNADGWHDTLSLSANWTAGYAEGSTALTLSSTTSIVANDTVLTLDQLNDSSDGGDIFVCTSTSCSDEGGCNHCLPDAGGRAQQQLVKVTAINGSVVTVTPGIYMPNWRGSQSPRAAWGTNIASGIGIEDLKIIATSIPDVNDASAILYYHARDSWIKNVMIYNPQFHVTFWHASHITVRDSYFDENHSHASLAYGLRAEVASDLLFDNNIFHHVTGPVELNGTCSGCVVRYNYMLDSIFTNPATFMIGGVVSHEGGADHVLIEGNDTNGILADTIHGSSHFFTAFRNRITGKETGDTDQTNPLLLFSFNRFYNFIGNIVGDNAYHNTYAANSATAIYDLGATPRAPIPSDSLVTSTLMRWGNYDTVNDATRFLASEVPSGLANYANPVPATETLPKSFSISTRPSWWGGPFGTPPWPPIGPDVTGGEIANVGGHAYLIPARLCYENIAKDGNGLLTNFSSANCYN